MSNSAVSNKLIGLFTASSILALSFCSTQAIAQAAQPKPEVKASDGEADSSEIIVTALRRSESLQRVPLSISAITDRGLAAIGATTLQDYFRSVPNLNLTQSLGGINRVSIRGINASGEATVGVYFDETPVAGPAGASADSGASQPDLNLFDIERVEVLRGPQGTLYGSSSMAGTLRIINKKPNVSKFEAAAEAQSTSVDGGGTGGFLKAMVNVPIVNDVLAARLVGYVERRPGYVDNVKLGQKNIDNGLAKGVRAMVGLTPTPDLNIVATGIYQLSKAKDRQGWFEAVGDYDTNASVKVPSKDELELYNLTANWKLPGITLTATGSYYRNETLRTFDFTAPVLILSQNPGFCPIFFAMASACSASQLSTFAAYGRSRAPAISWQPSVLKTKTAEVRASSSNPGLVDWTVGAFYEHRDSHSDSSVAQADAATGATPQPLNLISHRYIDTNLTQKAAFGEVTVHPLAGLGLTAGTRYFDYSKTTSGALDVANPISATFLSPFSSRSAHANGWLAKFLANYEVRPGLLVYGSASKGFRPGGANNIPSLSGSLVSYEPDKLWNYEVGLKSAWLDNRVIFNLSVYQIDWTNIQTSATISGVFSIITNAGAARIRGGEAELTVRPVTGLTFNLAGGVSDAKLTKDQVNPSIAATGATGRAGDRLPGVPDFTGSASIAYNWPMTTSFDGLLRADYAYTGRIQSTFHGGTDPNYEIYGKYGTLGLRAGIEHPGRGLYLFVQNLTNRKGVTGALTALGTKRLIYTIPPRTIGINARISY